MPLRQIQVHIPEDRVGDFNNLLEEQKIQPLWQGRDEKDASLMAMIVVDAFKTDHLIEELMDDFVEDEGFRLVIYGIGAVHPKVHEEDEEDGEPKEGEKQEEDNLQEKKRLAIEELEENLKGDSRITGTYLITVLISALVAAVGLIRGDTAVVIGAMVIAPLLGPNMALALGTTLGDFPVVRRAFVTIFVGAAVAFGFSVLLGMVLSVDPTGPEIASRTSVSYTAVLVALASGAAGAIAVTSGVSAALVGVMVAVALMPPLVAAGLLLGNGQLYLASDAALLVGINLISINLAAVTTFVVKDIKPRNYWDTENAARMTRAAFALWIGILALLVFLIWLSN